MSERDWYTELDFGCGFYGKEYFEKLYFYDKDPLKKGGLEELNVSFWKSSKVSLVGVLNGIPCYGPIYPEHSLIHPL